ncbi:hypothetical protein NECAME_09029 [Necator americanus]|uniref:Endonuclease/exonuclease/phosphatase domain-containing protein n=1 Tax=Necator americanus TaxID=51031 RepID=W2TGE4_NECAM|nr:hypothetical protein NECAME_09029 [Necator americanus]ETN80669.1 hypothetical protein NECAME_09029 [Necator americanus]
MTVRVVDQSMDYIAGSEHRPSFPLDARDICRGRDGRHNRWSFQESYRVPKRKRTRMAICTYNARTLASETANEDLMMQAKKIKYDVIGLTETRRRHPLNTVYEPGEELFL